MRLTLKDKHCHRYRVFLDGVERFDCVEADEERGVVTTIERRGLPFRTHKYTVRPGVVQIVPRGPADQPERKP